MAENVVAILGGRGMLGTDLADICRQQGFDVKTFDLPEFDITNPEQLKKAVAGVEAVVNCAAYTNVERAENEPELAYQVNGEAVGRLGDLAKDGDVWVLHISTDFIFDGRLDRPYVETDKPSPINAYGRSKLAGEELLERSGCRHCIIRAEWTYGHAGRNFITKLLDHVNQTQEMRVVDDQVGSPTATTELAKAICDLLRKKPEDLFHFASDGYASRYEMARFIFDKLSKNVNLLPCKSSDYKTAAARPLNSRFDCSKIKALLGGPIEPWQKPLEHFLTLL